jgi:hypothetical protein
MFIYSLLGWERKKIEKQMYKKKKFTTPPGPDWMV